MYINWLQHAWLQTLQALFCLSKPCLALQFRAWSDLDALQPCIALLPPPKHVFLYFSTFSLHFGIFYISLWFGIFGYLWFCILGSQCFGIFKETLPSLAQRACFYLVLLPVPASTLFVLLCFKHIFTVYNFLPSTQWPLATGNTHSQIALKLFWFSHVLFPNVLFLPSTFSKCTFSTHTFPHILLQMYFCTHVLLTNVVLQSSLAEWQVVTRIAEKTANVTFLPILPFPRCHDCQSCHFHD